jgi:hypothetical protein
MLHNCDIYFFYILILENQQINIAGRFQPLFGVIFDRGKTIATEGVELWSRAA